MAFFRNSANFIRTLGILIGFCFAVQVVVAAPTHFLHGMELAQTQHSGQDFSQKHSHLPEDPRCELCVALRTLHPGSAASPPVIALAESAFSLLPEFVSFLFTKPSLFAPARGPPSYSIV